MSATPRSCAVLLALAALLPLHASDRLTSRPRPTPPADRPLAVGATVTTGPNETRRVLLPDRSVVFVRSRTRLQVQAESALEVTAGEVFVETAGGKLAPTVVVRTPKRLVQGQDSRFGVRVGDDGTRLFVASGQVRVHGLKSALSSGQELREDATTPTTAPRISHLVTWTRELRNAAPLVPASEHAGGTLVARDPDGQEVKLSLRRYAVDVHIEDGFARTTIDQTFFNESEDRLEGTFRFPLPPDASLSRLAMYVEGKLMEGGMAERDHARAAYERIVFEKRDPALLEWVDGSTFKMRVFPLEARQEKRLLLSYTQKMPVLHGTLSYRFPAGHTLGQVGKWSLQARVKNGAGLDWQCESHTLGAKKEGGDLVLAATRKDAALDRDVVLRVAEASSGNEARFSSMRHEGVDYLLVRYRPELAGNGGQQRRDWVVLVESSGDRDPLLMRTQIELVRSLLRNASREDTFAILTANTRTKATKPLRNDLAAIDEAMAGLERAHLVGALDLGAAFAAARPLLEASKNPHLFHVGSGIAAMGDARTNELIARLPRGTRYVGAGVGRRWNRALMQTAAEQTGGYFTQVNPDEVLDWRGLEIVSALDAPRLLDVKIADPEHRATFLPFSRLLCQGEEVAAVARLEGGQMPARVRISGKLDGKEVVRDLEVKDVRENAAYLPRSWAKLEIDRLLAEDAARHKDAVVGLSKSMYVMTPFTSLLVLENDDMYTQFKVDRGRKDHWAMYPAPARIRVVYEPLDGGAGDPKRGIKPSPRVVWNTLRVRGQSMSWAGKRKGVERVDDFAKLIDLEKASEYLSFVVQKRLQDETFLQVTGGSGMSDPVNRAKFQADGSTLATLIEGKPGSSSRLIADRFRGNGLARELYGQFDVINTSGRDGSRSYSFDLDRIDEAVAFRSGGGWFQNSNMIYDQPPDKLEPERHAAPMPSSAPASLVYQRPAFSGDVRPFHDLLAYAPGLNSTSADLAAVLESEARPTPHGRPGAIATSARKLLADARKVGWRSVQVDARDRATRFTIQFDSADRWAWTRTLPSGLREQVVCDGKTLWHLYPENGLAAKRPVSRFHRLELATRVPEALPTPEDLARGADVVLLDERTVAVIPHAAKDDKGKPVPHVQLQLAFAKDGRLSERRLVEMPKGKVLRREQCRATEEAPAPGLAVEVSKLVVLPMPFRSVAHVQQLPGIKDRPVADLSFEQALMLLMAQVAEGQQEQAKAVFRDSLHRREQRQLGYYVLLAAAGVPLDSDAFDVMEEHPGNPLASYLAVHSSPVLRKHASRWAAASNAWGEGFLRRLGQGHALLNRFSSGRNLGTPAQREAERDRALAYVRQYAGTDLAFAVLCQVQDRLAQEEEHESTRSAWATLAKVFDQFVETPALAGAARYEAARCLARAGQTGEARKRFLALFEESTKDGRLPRLDGDFRSALLGADRDGWSELMRQTARQLTERKTREGVLLLARQCWQLDDQATAQSLVRFALEGVSPKTREGAALYLGAIAFLMQTGQHGTAEPLLDAVLSDPEHAKRPDLWRLAANLAEAREQPARRLECLERALALEHQHLPEVIALDRDAGSTANC